MATPNHPARLRAFAQALRRRSIGSALVNHAANIRYLCGFTGSAGILGISNGEARMFTDGRYTTQAAHEVQGADVVIDRSPTKAALSWLKGARVGRIGFDGTHLSARDYQILHKAFGHRKTVDIAGVAEELRMIKDAAEAERMRAAAKLGVELFEVALQTLRPGAKETQVAAKMEYAARMHGAEAMSFPTIVASGERSALPHGRASQAALPARGFVVLDFGVILCGYCSDMTRTVHLGKPGGRERKLYESVRRAQQAAVEAVRPGRTFAEIDAIARRKLEKDGWGEFFTHSTGHGVGLEIHEPPRLAAVEKGKLRAGMVITVEPGVYLPGEGGVRIEDMVLVTEHGHEVLTPAARHLIVL
jgi:Xaa-Pro aminopeptidase